VLTKLCWLCKCSSLQTGNKLDSKVVALSSSFTIVYSMGAGWDKRKICSFFYKQL
jgi:hypothetical protein